MPRRSGLLRGAPTTPRPPNFPRSPRHRASTYVDMKQYTLALADYAKALRLAPKDVNHHFNRGVAWLAMKDYQRALHDFSRARTLGKDDTMLWLNLGVA